MPTKSGLRATRPAASIPAWLAGIIAATSLLLVPSLAAARQTDSSRGELGAAVRTVVPSRVGDLAPVLKQHSPHGGSSGGGGGGQAVPRGGSGGGSGGGAGSGGGTRSGGGSGGDPASGGSGGGARTRSGSGAGAANGSGDGSSGTPTYSRPREGRPATGTAVERRGDSGGGNRGNGGTVVIGGGYYGGFYPWGWGGLGLGGYYGYYDPYGWDDPYPQSVGYGYGNDGALKLKVTPRQAEVLVDGYFAGAVDDYDGLFQRLRLEAGPHRIEVRLDGYEPLSFEVRIQPDRTVTYRGDMRRENPDN